MDAQDASAGLQSALHEAALDDALWPYTSARVDGAL